MAISNRHISTLIILIYFCLTFASFSHCVPRTILIEKVEDFATYKFDCTDTNGNPCHFRSVQNASLLPSYFPSKYRELESDNGLMYVESTSVTNFFNIITRENLPGTIMSFEAEYYTEKDYTIGSGQYCCSGGSPYYGPYPGSTYGGGWTTYGRPFESRRSLYKVGFYAQNDRSTEFVVIKRLKIIVDAEPNMSIEVKNLEDIKKFGVTCSEGINECQIKSVNAAAHLPEYFSESFRNLTTEEGSSIMYVEGNGDSFGKLQLLMELPVQFVPNPSGAINFRAEYYTESQDVIGYGPLLHPSYPKWVNFGRSYNSVWKMQQSHFLEYMRSVIEPPMSKFGFFTFNNKENEYVVFRKLEISFWFTPESVIEPSRPTTVVTVPETTTVRIPSIETTLTSSETTDSETSSTVTSITIITTAPTVEPTEPSSVSPEPTSSEPGTTTENSGILRKASFIQTICIFYVILVLFI